METREDQISLQSILMVWSLELYNTNCDLCVTHHFLSSILSVLVSVAHHFVLHVFSFKLISIYIY